MGRTCIDRWEGEIATNYPPEIFYPSYRYWYTHRKAYGKVTATGTKFLSLAHATDFVLTGGAAIVSNDGGEHAAGADTNAGAGQRQHSDLTHRALSDPSHRRSAVLATAVAEYDPSTGNHYRYPGPRAGDAGDAEAEGGILNIRSGKPHQTTGVAMYVAAKAQLFLQLAGDAGWELWTCTRERERT